MEMFRWRSPDYVVNGGEGDLLAKAFGVECAVRWLMTRDTIDTAVREGIPFVINMADGKSYEVREATKIAIGRTRVVVLDDRDLPHILPMLTMTGISYLPGENGAK
jgi:hypothetical protein